jgi:hypothetical protein
MVFQPMLELLEYLRSNGFKTFIVSGGGIEFMRPWTEIVYGIPPEQVVGSSIKTAYEVRDGVPVIARLPELNFIDDKEGKPLGINSHIGRRPIAAFGNSDGDFQMLEWTTSGDGARLGVLIHHTDAEREWAYDRESHIGRLDRGLNEAPDRGWIVVNMKDDWGRIYPYPESIERTTTGYEAVSPSGRVRQRRCIHTHCSGKARICSSMTAVAAAITSRTRSSREPVLGILSGGRSGRDGSRPDDDG